jgi:FkbM family methyltransferase
MKLKLFGSFINSVLARFKSPIDRTHEIPQQGTLPPFDTFLMRERAQTRLSKFRPRYPFALERGSAAKRLLTTDPNSRFGHEPELAHLLDMLMPDDAIFLDVGSNFGYFSIYIATRPGFHGHIHAFEPIEKSFSSLQELVNSLQCDKVVTCHQMAVSDKSGTAKMDIGSDPGLASIKDDTFEQGETVQITTLDSLNLDRVDFIKIDVEGHEAAALRGADALISTHKPYIFLESWIFPEDQNKVFGPLKFLIDHGYNLYLPAWAQSNGTFFVGIGPGFEMDNFALVPFNLDDRTTFPGNPINIFAAPKSRETALGKLWSAVRQRNGFFSSANL